MATAHKVALLLSALTLAGCFGGTRDNVQTRVAGAAANRTSPLLQNPFDKPVSESERETAQKVVPLSEREVFRAKLQALPTEDKWGHDINPEVMIQLRDGMTNVYRVHASLYYLKARTLDQRFSTTFALIYGKLLFPSPRRGQKLLGAAMLTYSVMITRVDARRCGSVGDYSAIHKRREVIQDELKGVSRMFTSLTAKERQEVEIIWGQMEYRTAKIRKDVPLCQSALEYLDVSNVTGTCQNQKNQIGRCSTVGQHRDRPTKWADESPWQKARRDFHKALDDGRIFNAWLPRE